MIQLQARAVMCVARDCARLDDSHHNVCRSQHDIQDREALTPVSALAAILPGSTRKRGCAEPTPLALQLTPEAAGSCDSPVLAAGRPAAGETEVSSRNGPRI